MGTLLYSFQLVGSPNFGGQFGALQLDYGFEPLTLKAMFFTITNGLPTLP